MSETDAADGAEAGLEAAGYRYFAFVSYSHRDRRWGDWLHRVLEGYRVPPQLVGQASPFGPVPARIFPVFRDREELPTSADLGGNIDAALRASRCLVVICSPRSAASHWVNEEVRNFKALGRENRVICLIVDGEPNASDKPDQAALECFPPAIRFRVTPDGTLSDERTEPIAADVRPQGDGRDNAKLKLIAGILGVGFDALRQREQRRRQRRLVIATAAMGVLTVVMAGLAGLAWFGWQQAERQEALALTARDQAEHLASSMLYDFRDKLEPLGRLDLLKDNAVLIRDYYLALPPEHSNPTTEKRRATSLMSIGDVLVEQGSLDEAYAAFAESEQILERARDAAPQNLEAVRSWTVIANRIGDQQRTLGKLAAARDYYTRSVASSRRLRDAPDLPAAWRRDLMVGVYKLGQVELQAGEHTTALEHFREAVALARAELARAPDRQSKLDLLTALSGLAGVHEERREHGEALELLVDGLPMERELVAAHPEDYLLAYGLTVSLSRIGGLYFELHDLDAAATVGGERVALTERLTAHDPSNIVWLRARATAHMDEARIAERRGDVAQARAGYRQALSDFKALNAQRGDDVEAQFDVAIVYNTLGDLESSLGGFDVAEAHFRAALAIGDALMRASPEAERWRNAVATYHGKIGDAALAQGAVDRARTALDRSLALVQALADADPDNIQYQRDLSIALGRLARLERATGDASAAIERYWQILALDEALLAALPDDPEAVQDLAISYSQLGRAYQLAGDLDQAAAQFAEALALRIRFGAMVPSAPGWRADAAESRVALGDIERARGQAARAESHYRGALAHYTVLTDGQPGRVGWQRAKAFAHNRMAAAVGAQGRYDEAREQYGLAYAIVRILAAVDPDNVLWQTDHALSLRILAQGARLPQDRAMAIDFNRQALAIVATLAARDALPASFAAWLDDIPRDLELLDQPP